MTSNKSRIVEGSEVPGTARWVFRPHHGDVYRLVRLEVYADEVIVLQSSTMDLAGLAQMIDQGRIVTRLPENASLWFFELGSFRVHDYTAFAESPDLVGEARDEIDRLKERPDSGDRCREALKNYLRNPSDLSLEEVRRTYEEIPAHRKPYVLHDQDSKDWPVKRLLEGNENERLRHGKTC